MSAFQSLCEHYEKGKPFSQGTPLVAREAGDAIAVHLEHLPSKFALLAFGTPVVVLVENLLRAVHPVADEFLRVAVVEPRGNGAPSKRVWGN